MPVVASPAVVKPLAVGSIVMRVVEALPRWR
jgi:hypothetical protein